MKSTGLSSTIKRVKIKEQICQHIRENRRIDTEENASEMETTSGNKVCNNGLRKPRNILL
jgi:hypothetical protein